MSGRESLLSKIEGKKAKIAAPIGGSVVLSGVTLGANTVTHTVSVPGARIGDVVSLGLTPELYQPDLVYYGFVSAADTLTIAIRDLSVDIHVFNGSIRYLITSI